MSNGNHRHNRARNKRVNRVTNATCNVELPFFALCRKRMAQGRSPWRPRLLIVSHLNEFSGLAQRELSKRNRCDRSSRGWKPEKRSGENPQTITHVHPPCSRRSQLQTPRGYRDHPPPARGSTCRSSLLHLPTGPRTEFSLLLVDEFPSGASRLGNADRGCRSARSTVPQRSERE